MRLSLLALLILVSFQAAFANYQLHTILTPSPKKLAQELRDKGFDVVTHNLDQLFVQVITNNEHLLPTTLPYKGIITSTQNSQALATKLTDGLENYLNWDDTLGKLKSLEATYESFAKLVDLNQLLQLPTTEEGNRLYALRVSNQPEASHDRPKILIIGQHHAREVMTHHAVMDAATEYLQKLKSNEAQALENAKNVEVWFVPVVNPDGLNYVFSHNNMWRKNRAIHHQSYRGVDLNRNYKFKWGACGSNSSSPSSEIYKGPTPHSEPEVQIMDKLNSKLKAQYLISYHSSGNEVLYPYVCGTLAEQRIYYDVRDRLATHLNFGMRPASSSGEDFEHHYARHGSIAFLLEIGRSFQPSYQIYQQTVLTNTRKVLPFLFNELKKPHLNIKVISEVNPTTIAKARVTVKGRQFQEGEVRETDMFGSLRWRLDPGSYEVMVEAEGYLPSTKQIQLTRSLKQTMIELKQAN